MIVALLALMSAPADACGPDFPTRLLEQREAVLLAAPEGTFAHEVQRLVPARPGTWPLEVGTRRDQRAAGLTDTERAILERAATAPTVAAALEIAAPLPEELRWYAAGARQYHLELGDLGRAYFEKVVALPADARTRRGIWARYMLGQYEALRAEVLAGAPDPMGLAVASLGEEAQQLLDTDLPRAIALYAEQAAMGSASGVLSLRYLMRSITRDVSDTTLVRWVADPVMRRALTAYVWTRPMEVAHGPTTISGPRLLAAIDAAGIQAPGHPDQLASIAYQAADYEQARRHAATSDAPLAWWVKAKLALRDGDRAAAADAYAKAAAGFPTQEAWRMGIETGWGRSYVDMPVKKIVTAEQSLLRLTRGDYVSALRGLLAAVEDAPGYHASPQGWEDAAYVAERVLTVDELLTFVQEEANTLEPPVRERLEPLLARRLVREGRPGEAVPYFQEPELAQQATAYADALARTTRGSALDRAEALLEAGALVRPGIDLLGTEGAPDYQVYEGVYERWSETPLTPETPEWRGPDEAERVAASAATPDLRFHYRQIASAHAEAAADLLPTDSLAFAVSLCRAAEYVMMRGPSERVEALYLRYLREGPLYEGSESFGHVCPDPDFAGLRSRLDGERMRRWLPVGALLGVSLVLVAALVVARQVRPR